MEDKTKSRIKVALVAVCAFALGGVLALVAESMWTGVPGMKGTLREVQATLHDVHVTQAYDAIYSHEQVPDVDVENALLFLPDGTPEQLSAMEVALLRNAMADAAKGVALPVSTSESENASPPIGVWWKMPGVEITPEEIRAGFEDESVGPMTLGNILAITMRTDGSWAADPAIAADLGIRILRHYQRERSKSAQRGQVQLVTRSLVGLE